MENRNGQGIFLGVVGVATLVVAIIGATFAFFSAQITGTNNVEAQAYNFASSLVVTEKSDAAGEGLNGKLVPMNEDDLTKATNNESTKGMCIDKKGYDACQIYELKFENSGSATVKFNGLLTINTNTFEANHLQLVEVDGTLGNFSNPNAHALAQSGTVPLGEVEVPTTGETIYLVVYLKELGQENAADMGDTFNGTLTYTSADGNQLTADFTA